MRISRRSFLGTTALGGLAVNAAHGAEIGKNGGLPKRTLGRTGARVSILAMGGGSRFLMYKEEDKALEALNRAFDLGITYMDTAYGYGNGLSETRVGKVMAERRKRDGIFLATKIEARKGDEAARTIEGSLKRLQTDQIDLIHIHSLEDEADLAQIEAKDGILNRLLKLRDEKVTRFVGITCHNDPTVLATALGRHDFDCTQMALNAALATSPRREDIAVSVVEECVRDVVEQLPALAAVHVQIPAPPDRRADETELAWRTRQLWTLHASFAAALASILT